jgi:hypothetical protein
VLSSEDQFCRQCYIGDPHLIPSSHLVCLSDRSGTRLVRNLVLIGQQAVFHYMLWVVCNV